MLHLEPTCKPIAEVNIVGMTFIPVKTVTYVYATSHYLPSYSLSLGPCSLSLLCSLSVCLRESLSLSLSLCFSLSLSEDELIRHKEKNNHSSQLTDGRY